jgi:hypothetical protein
MSSRIKDSTLATLREVVDGDPYHKQFRPLIDEIDRLRAAIERVRALHRSGLKGAVCNECEYDHPCPTLRALDGEGA